MSILVKNNSKGIIFILILSTTLLINPPMSQASEQMIPIPQGKAMIGGQDENIEEEQLIQQISSFRITRTEITNAEFATFVQASKYQTDAEQKGWGWVWKGRWQKRKGADWRHPQGAESNIVNKEQHPVVQVSWHDAQGYCQWYQMRIPTEPEWEYAARGGDSRLYPWGNTHPRSGGLQRANYGTDRCCAPDTQDGYRTTAPVGIYPEGASPFGVLDMAGNVWEWVLEEHPAHPGYKIIRGGGWGNNPDCLKTTYRHVNLPTASLDMVGFRCVQSD